MSDRLKCGLGPSLERVRRALLLLIAAAVVVAVVIGLSQAGGEPKGDSLPAYSLPKALQQLRGAPEPLAALHADANQVLADAPEAMPRRLRRLRGHPVVVNKWASWCGPCRLEFPFFQRAAAHRGKEVAFVGLNAGDNRRDAEEFLEQFPIPFPSYEDPDEKMARELGIPANYPITLFLDENGKQAFVHQGQYKRLEDLEADIDRYLLR